MEPGAAYALIIRLSRIGDDALGLPSTLIISDTLSPFDEAAGTLEACSDIRD